MQIRPASATSNWCEIDGHKDAEEACCRHGRHAMALTRAMPMRVRGSEATRAILSSVDEEEACGDNDAATHSSSAMEYNNTSVAVAAHRNVRAPFHVALAAEAEEGTGAWLESYNGSE